MKRLLLIGLGLAVAASAPLASADAANLRLLTSWNRDNWPTYAVLEQYVKNVHADGEVKVGISGKEVVKTIMVTLDDRMAMAVLRAPDKVNLDALAREVGAAHAELATEEQFKGLFPAVDPGAMPPFGNLYDMPVYVDGRVAQDKRIAFNAGTHSELIQLAYDDYIRLVEPRVLDFAWPP